MWRWFLTFAASDVYEPRLYEILITTNSSLGLLKNMDKKCRTSLLRQHPALAARVFYLKQECLWKLLIVTSQSRPLTAILTDWWRRIEFQGGGTAHTHAMCAVRHDGITENMMTSADIQTQKIVTDHVKEVITAKLVSRVWNQQDHYDENNDRFLMPDFTEIARKEAEDQRDEDEIKQIVLAKEIEHLELERNFSYQFEKNCFDDSHDPRRLTFDENLDYSLNAQGDFACPLVQTRYRHFQIASQNHICHKTCTKYNINSRDKTCRFGFSYKPDNVNEPITENLCKVVTDRDRHRRVRFFFLFFSHIILLFQHFMKIFK